LGGNYNTQKTITTKQINLLGRNSLLMI